MRLDGGIDQYSMFGERYMSETPPLGRKVTYLDKNGYEIERETANSFFREGEVLTIKEIYVGRSSSEVEFIEHPNKMFNTVMFADVESAE